MKRCAPIAAVLLTAATLLLAPALHAQPSIEYRRADGTLLHLEAAADDDSDGLSNELEVNGFTYSPLGGLQPCTSPEGAGCYFTDPLSWSTDQDPYSDFDEATGRNMPTTIFPPYNHPLVAARPVIVVGLLNYTVTPKGTITNSENHTLSTGWKNVTTSRHQAGASIKAGYGTSPFKPVSVEGEAHYSYTHTSTTTTTRDETFSFAHSTTQDPSAAAELALEVYYENLGSAPALQVRPTFNVLIGERVVKTYTPTRAAPEMGVPSTSTSRYPAGNAGIVVGGPDLILTLDDVKALAAGAEISIAVVDIEAQILRSNGAGQWGECGSTLSCSWTTFQSNIEGSAFVLNVDIGDDSREYYVYAGNQYFDPALTLGDVLDLTMGLDHRAEGTYVEDRKMPGDWYLSSTSASLLAAYDQDAPLRTPIDSRQALFMAAPGTDPGPEILLATYTPDLRDVIVAPTSRGGFPVWKVEAFFEGRPGPIPMLPTGNGLYYRLPSADTLLTNGLNYVEVTDAGGFTTRASISQPAFDRSCADATIDLPVAEQDADRLYAIFFDGDPEIPIQVWCDFSTTPARTRYAQNLVLDTRAYYNVHFADRRHGVLVGQNSQVTTTTDGGHRAFVWHDVGIPASVHDGYMTDTLTIHVVGSPNGSSSRPNYAFSTDGGATWTSRNLGTSQALFGLDFLGADTAVAVGGGGQLRLTEDAGANWTPVGTNTAFTLYDVDVVSDTFGVAVGASGRVIRSRGDLNHWNSQLVGGSNPDLHSVHFRDVQTGLAVGDGGAIFKTINGGVTWQQKSSGTNVNLWRVQFVNTEMALAVGLSGAVLRSLDGGETWARLPAAPPTLNYIGLHAFNENDLYLVGHTVSNAQGIFAETRSAFGAPVATNRVIVAVEAPETPPAAAAHTLGQNFPNPFRGRTTIRYHLAAAGPVTLAVYDLLGREVARLVDEPRAAGEHEATFDASGLASGLYVYRLCAGTHVQTQTMVVLN